MRYEDVKRGYVNLYNSMRISEAQYRVAESQAADIYAKREIYRKVHAITGVPWFWIGIVHVMECDQDFGTHLHNGDPITAKTIHEPAGRPDGEPPFTWIESAVDALKLKQLDDVDKWPLSRCLYEFERFNGFGYFKHGINSPYLWSFSDLYKRGKYDHDGHYNADLVSQQTGCAVLLKVMVDKGLLEDAPAIPEKDKSMIGIFLDTILGGERLKGYKTIIGIVGWCLLNVLESQGILPGSVLTQSTLDTVEALLAGYAGLGAIAKYERNDRPFKPFENE